MSKIEVDAIDKQSGSTLTLGGSGTAVTLACGATQTGFGRSGSVNWDTTPKTATFTGVSGNGYFVNTTAGVVTANLPASPSAGDIMAVVDYAGTADTNNITVGRNGSNINGAASDTTISKENSGATFVYVDGTQGWKFTETANIDDITLTPAFVVGSGGTITCCGNYKIHTFTGPGTFTVSCAGNALGSNSVDYLVIAGGAGGGLKRAGGGGAGGFRESVPSPAAWTASPLAASNGALPVSAQSYPIVVGAGGTGGTANNPVCSAATTPNEPGAASSFSTISSAGGGKGGGTGTPDGSGQPGGSGGGGFTGTPIFPTSTPVNAGTGNTPPVSPAQGTNGGAGLFPYSPGQGGGGGGAGAAGNPANNSGSPGSTDGKGGDGVATSITASPVTRAGGGGGGSRPNGYQGQGGTGGGGRGSNNQSAPWGSNEDGENGTVNTGSGGGGSGDVASSSGGAGGSGLVVIRYKFQ